MSKLAYRRILLKLSGEALMGDEDYGIDPKVINRLAREVIEAQQAGAEVALVIGGGNIFRRAGLAAGGMDRVTGDQMGMLATVINALAMQDALEKLGGKVRVMSALKINDVCEDYIRRRAVCHLEKGRIGIFAAGTGNPFFTTDSAAALRAIEINGAGVEGNKAAFRLGRWAIADPRAVAALAGEAAAPVAEVSEAAEQAPAEAADVNVAAIVGSVVAALAVLGIAGAGFAAMNGLLPF